MSGRSSGRMTGPAVVAVGGGHGLAATLRAARRYAGSITAIVSVADDGGSSGRLRAAMPDLPAPGDVRRCLSALAAEDSALGRSLEHRFTGADGPLTGHAFGNLVLVALADELGGFPAAVDEVARLVEAAGRVLPATVGPVGLEGRRAPATVAGRSGPVPAGVAGDVAETVVGQVAVQNAGGMARLALDPADPPSPVGVAASIAVADQVLVGPGSLFTSVLAAAIVPAVRDALHATSARRVYVANLGPQVPETEGFTLADHLAVLAHHEVPVDVVVARPGLVAECAEPLHSRVEVVEADIADDRGRVHHPDRLAAVLARLV